MITIITGTPGTGKTSYVVSELMTTTGRNIYVDGIPDLVLPHEVCPPVGEWVKVDKDADGATSHTWNFPPNSIIIVDEAQRNFRPRPAGSKVPDYVAALETHRHAGLDFWFITQHPALIESNVRRLCGRHVHIRTTAIGRRLHEWTQVEDPENASARASAVTRPYKLPKEAFGKYKSAEVHTKNKARLPLSMFVVIAAIVGFIVVAWFTYGSVKKKIEPAKVSTTDQHSAASIHPSQGVVSQGVAVDPAELLTQFDARVPGRPETAPAFDALRVVKNMPVVVGCVQTSTRCTCVNQQGLDANLDKMQCESWLKNPPFNPYVEWVAENQHGRGDNLSAVPKAVQNQPLPAPIDLSTLPPPV